MEKTPLKNRHKDCSLGIEEKIKTSAFLNPKLQPISILLPVACLLLSSSSAFAITVSVGLNPTPAFPKTSIKPKGKPSSKDPILLTAQYVDYDKEKQIVSASGKVEIVQGDTIMLADHVLYDQVDNTVMAHGNVSILESAGNVLFADDIELKDDLKAGVINQFKARLADNSLFVANNAKKHDENITELYQAAYSPCKVCYSGNDGKTPLWQLEAEHITINKEEQTVKYDDALMEIYGVPIFYTPYFSHPTPNADNKSGLLTPTLKQSTNLGTVYKQPIYYSLAPDKDFTITPIFTTLEGPVVAGEYRQLYDSGTLNLTGSITKPQTRDAGGINSKGQNIRGHIDGEGHFKINDYTDWGFNVRRASDDTYLRRYDFSNDSLLTSRLYAEKHDFLQDFSGTKSRSFASLQALKFMGLTAADNSRLSPVVLPLADFDWESAPAIYNSRFIMDGNIMALTRDIGAESRRISTTAGWKLPYITENGQVLEFATQLRSDIYWIEDQQLGAGQNFSGQTGRVIPQASLTWRYPFINSFDNGNILIEPVAMVAASPNSSNSNKIPNEDSQVPEFNTSNLFSPNRFAGYDRVETGTQASYGIRGQAQIFNDKYIDLLVGQHYRSNTSNNFPYSNDPDSNFSDYVGKIGINYDPIYIYYRTRLDKDSLAFNQNEVAGSFNYYPVTVSTSYLSLNNDPTLQDREEITGAFGVNLTRKWNLGFSATKDLDLNSMRNAYATLTFSNECIYITNSFGRDYTTDRDIKPSTTYMFRVSFKNLD